MPRYYFDTECGDLRYHDKDGIELESIDQAQEHLVGLLRDMTLYDDIGAPSKTVTVQVRCNGAVVLQGSCSLAINRPSVPSPKLWYVSVYKELGSSDVECAS